MKKKITFLTILGLIFASSFASAEVSVYRQNLGDDKSGYGYEFDDDPLNAGGFGPNDALIKVRKKAARATLIRPRTSFIYEMLKSVEDISYM